MPHHRQRQAKTRTPDLACNEPFKAKVTEKYDVWMANGAHLFTAAGNNCVAHLVVKSSSGFLRPGKL